MKTNEIRSKYLDFFQSKDHRICDSDVLVPKADPTVLFTPAGMNQFKEHFLGNVELEFTRATTCQKCLRTGDINNVGRTAYHHTFFEMLGNFSFGDYFKREAINWAWEFLTEKKWMGIDPDRLSVTIYLDDEEAQEIWSNDIGLKPDKITREDEDENFWPASAPSQGPDGVCGPCSEIYFTPDDGKKVEIWNLVFTQFNRCGNPPNNLTPLPNKNIDTGMGLERISAVMQNVTTNYHIDSLRPLVEAAGEVCSTKYDPESDEGRRLRRIADHVRACTFAIHENTNPGPKGEPSVIRTLMRRAFLDGYQLGLREAFLFELVPKVIELCGETYPELSETAARVQATMKSEESGFLNTVESGIARVNPMIQTAKSQNVGQLSGEQVFQLHTTHGVPVELTEKVALDAGLGIDRKAYDDLIKQHGDASNSGPTGVMGGGPFEAIKKEQKSTRFVGYELTRSEATIKGLVDQGSRQETLNNESSDEAVIVLDQTPFYAESGGQVGDKGTIESPTGKFEVSDTQKEGELYKHIGKVVSGEFSDGQNVNAEVDSDRRDGIRRAHSATHILHFALQTHVGKHAQQQGSKVEDDYLRFDYSHPESVDDEQLLQVENCANEKVNANDSISAAIVPLEEAKSAGAMMLFGEKYPDPCRMVSMGEFSRELCGGTHLSNTGEVGLVEIKNDSNLSAGTRRIEVFTGKKAESHRGQIERDVQQCSKQLNCSVGDLPQQVQALIDQSKSLKKQLESGKVKDEGESKSKSIATNDDSDFIAKRAALKQAARLINTDLFQVAPRVSQLLAEVEKLKQQLGTLQSSGGVSADDLIASAQDCDGVKVISAELPGGNPNLMRSTIDQIRKKTSPVAVLLAAAVGESKVLLVAGISKELVDRGLSAGNWVKVVAPIVGGGGGGKPDMAQAGGKQPEKIGEAVQSASGLFESMLN